MKRLPEDRPGRVRRRREPGAARLRGRRRQRRPAPPCTGSPPPTGSSPSTPPSPCSPPSDVAVTGLAAGEQLIGIDRRPKTGALYGVGKLGTAGPALHRRPRHRRGHVRRHPGDRTHRRRAAPARRSPSPAPSSGSTSTPRPTPCASSATPARTCGSSRPTACRPPSPCSPATRSPTAPSTSPAPPPPASAPPPTPTTTTTPPPAPSLYDIDTRRDLLVKQDPPNAGTLVTVGSLRFPAGLGGRLRHRHRQRGRHRLRRHHRRRAARSPCSPRSTWPPARPR